MTERPSGRGPGEHPDEGTIHAWLDDALDAAAAERVAAHVRRLRGVLPRGGRGARADRGCVARSWRRWTTCRRGRGPAGRRARSARAASADARRSSGSARSRDRSLWRRLRVTPARAAIAATILVAARDDAHARAVAMESSRRWRPRCHSEQRDVRHAASPDGGRRAAAAPQRRMRCWTRPWRGTSRSRRGRAERWRRRPAPAIPSAPPPSATPLRTPGGAAEQTGGGGRAAVAGAAGHGGGRSRPAARRAAGAAACRRPRGAATASRWRRRRAREDAGCCCQ